MLVRQKNDEEKTGCLKVFCCRLCREHMFVLCGVVLLVIRFMAHCIFSSGKMDLFLFGLKAHAGYFCADIVVLNWSSCFFFGFAKRFSVPLCRSTKNICRQIKLFCIRQRNSTGKKNQHRLTPTEFCSVVSAQSVSTNCRLWNNISCRL